MALTSKQRAALRSAANTMDPVYQIGKGEIDDTLKQGIADCIAARELIKVKVLENSEYSAREAADILCEALDCECVEMRDRVDRDGAIGWLRCGLDAMRRRTRAMEPFDTRRALQDYRLVILGTPIWAGRCSSIARGFLKRRGLEVQNIAYVVVHGSEELYKDVCDQMDQYVDHPHVADVSLRIGSAGYHFWRDEFIRNVTNYMTAEN